MDTGRVSWEETKQAMAEKTQRKKCKHKTKLLFKVEQVSPGGRRELGAEGTEMKVETLLWLYCECS